MSRFQFAVPAHCISVAMLVVIFAGTADAQKLRPANRASHDQSVGFDVFLPLQNQAELDQLLVAQQTLGSPNYHKWLTPQEFRARFGAKPEDVAKVSRALQSYGMTVTRTHSHGVHVQAQAGSVETAFGTALWTAKTANNHSKLITTEPLILPAALKETGAQIVHFSPMVSHRVHSKAMGAIPENRMAPYGPYWVTDLKQAYQFPSGEYLTGKG
jgi:subtilase family serine protease